MKSGKNFEKIVGKLHEFCKILEEIKISSFNFGET